MRILFRLLSEATTPSNEAISTAVAALSQLYAPDPPLRNAKPPRAIAASMANAVYAQPHLSVTFPKGQSAREAPFTISTEALSAALGLEVWELDDLREEVDRRASSFLMQLRAMKWLRARFDGSPDHHLTLFRALFPGSSPEQMRSMHFDGSRLYIAVQGSEDADPLATYLGWTHPKGPAGAVRFESRYVDVGMRRRMAVSIGGSDETIRVLLERIVCLTTSPRPEILLADRWRSEGWSHLTGLGSPPSASASYTLPLIAGQIDHTTFFNQVDDKLGLRAVRASFDHLALPRLEGATRDMYAAMMAKVLSGGSRLPLSALFDVRGHMKTVFEPLITWTTRSSTVTHLARTLDTTPGAARVLLHQVQSDWVAQSRGAWGGVPTEANPDTVRGILSAHLACTYESLMELWLQPADMRFPHRGLLLLFSADHHHNAQLARLWLPKRGLIPQPEDAVGSWFWHCWQRILDAKRADENLTEVPLTLEA